MRTTLLNKAQRLVIKFGTGILTDDRNHPDVTQMQQLADQIAELKKQGRDVVLVSSGAVGAGSGESGPGKAAPVIWPTCRHVPPLDKPGS